MKRLGIVVFLSLIVIFFAPWIGSTSRIDLTDFIFWQLRAPRVIAGFVVGATLGITGAAFQSLFGNPLATPSTTGTTAGASLGALVAILLLPNESIVHLFGVSFFAFVGAMVVSIAITVLATKRNMHIEDILLAGIALTLAAGAVTTGLQFQADMASTYRAVQWSLGSLSQVGYDSTIYLFPLCLAACIGILWQTRALETMISGEEQAFTQGVSIQRVRSAILFFGGLGVAVSVAWCGPIAFIGLVVPHIVRLTFNNTRRILLPMSGVVGGAFLVFCDAIARIIFSGQELPVGVLTALIGAPLLIFLVVNRRR
jgi:iron complex transport system permease protein